MEFGWTAGARVGIDDIPQQGGAGSRAAKYEKRRALLFGSIDSSSLLEISEMRYR